MDLAVALRILLLALLTVVSAAGAHAQGAEQPAAAFDSATVVHADTAPLPAGQGPAAHAADSLAFPATRVQQPQLARALAGLIILNGAAVAINNIARDLPTTRPETWWRNVRGGWAWDGNNISTNNIEHPYGGAVYYNVARANGLSFWASAPVTLAGSLMWELFGEPVPPSTNDLIITTLSGITLGEATRRLSTLVLDNHARGIDRVWRETAVLFFNPGMGLDRLSRGQTWHQRPNPLDRRPGSLRATLAFGARRMTLPAGSTSARMNVAVAAFGLQYGDPFNGARVQPFSWFTFSAELASGPSTTVTELGTRGMLAALGRRDGATRHVSGVFIDFEYQWNEAFQFSQQSFGIGLLSRTGSSAWRLNTDISAELLPLVASSDPYAEETVSRMYDYGAGVGGRAFAQLEYRGFRVLSAGYRGFWTATVNGASQSKLIQFAKVEARAPLPLGLSAGAAYNMYLQRSTYAGRSAASVSLPQMTVFLSTSGR